VLTRPYDDYDSGCTNDYRRLGRDGSTGNSLNPSDKREHDYQDSEHYPADRYFRFGPESHESLLPCFSKYGVREIIPRSREGLESESG
jgi:hypothetical protein